MKVSNYKQDIKFTFDSFEIVLYKYWPYVVRVFTYGKGTRAEQRKRHMEYKAQVYEHLVRVDFEKGGTT